MKQFKITFGLGLLIAGMGYGHVSGMFACFRCCKVPKCCKKAPKSLAELIISKDIAGLELFIRDKNNDLLAVSGDKRWTLLHRAVLLESDVLVGAVIKRAQEEKNFDTLVSRQNTDGKTALDLANDLAKNIAQHNKVPVQQDLKQCRRDSLNRVSHTDASRIGVMAKILELLEPA